MTGGVLLDGLIWHGPCNQLMLCRRTGAEYVCDRCGAVVPAVDTEQTVTLGALLRASAAVRLVGRQAGRVDPDRVEIAGPHRIPAAEIQQWLAADLSDRAAVLRIALTRVTVDATGRLRLTWRHQELVGTS